jgi:hypothetical protein
MLPAGKKDLTSLETNQTTRRSKTYPKQAAFQAYPKTIHARITEHYGSLAIAKLATQWTFVYIPMYSAKK